MTATTDVLSTPQGAPARAPSPPGVHPPSGRLVDRALAPERAAEALLVKGEGSPHAFTRPEAAAVLSEACRGGRVEA